MTRRVALVEDDDAFRAALAERLALADAVGAKCA